MIKVDKNIQHTGIGHTKYPFAEMDVGDSFLVPQDEKIASVRSAAVMYAARKSGSVKFSIKKHLGGYRCWRIA